jgi:hypothetical protein
VLRQFAAHRRSIEHDQLFGAIDCRCLSRERTFERRIFVQKIDVGLGQPGRLRDDVRSRRKRLRGIPQDQRQPREQ